MQRRTVIVEGPLAFHMRRSAAASNASNGLQILTLPQLAGRLAGGYRRPAERTDLEPAIKRALNAGKLRELDKMRTLPGMTRAVGRTLAKIWSADVDLRSERARHPRLDDLAIVEERIRKALPNGVLTPIDLRGAALARLSHAPAVIGPIELHRLSRIAPVWRPLLRALNDVVGVEWQSPSTLDLRWFSGRVIADAATAAAVSVVSCADPHAEAVEALRWARELIASGKARPEEIGICAPDPSPWDEHLHVLIRSSSLPIHFTHGLSALATREGQACAALADILVRGLSQDRVRRLMRHAQARANATKNLPADWAMGLRGDAGLFELGHWRQALDAAMRFRSGDVRPILLPVLALLSQGLTGAAEAGEKLLDPLAQLLWAEALASAPPEAVELALQELRVPDAGDPCASVAWGPAAHFVGAPRKWMRLLGLTGRSWPRRGGEDPLLPDHILPREQFDPEPVTVRDRLAFDVILRTSQSCVLSRSRRNAQGNLISPSPLLPNDGHRLKRGRIPDHAFSESDRLLARTREAHSTARVASASRCWNNRLSVRVTAHDGLTRSQHPLVLAALGETHSPTSLRVLVRDPLAFVWRYVLGWRSAAEDDQPLSLDPRAYGELVHELLRRAVDNLEPTPGYGGAALHDLEAALSKAVEDTYRLWPLERSVPPPLLWQSTLDGARTLAMRALTFDKQTFQPTTRSWTEVPFGDVPIDGELELPWTKREAVKIPGTELRVRGKIDRLDLNASGDVRVSDYKTGHEPRNIENAVLRGGNELQRAIYALAVRQLRPETTRVQSRFLYLGEHEPQARKLPAVDEAIALMANIVRAASMVVTEGRTLPGPDAGEEGNEFRLAIPAGAVYHMRKRLAFAEAFGEHARIWRTP